MKNIVLILLILLQAATAAGASAPRRTATVKRTAVAERRVVNVPVAGVFAKRSVASERVTEVLLGDEFRIISSEKGWAYGSIPSQKDYKGWIALKDLLSGPDERFYSAGPFIQVKTKNAKILTADGKTLAVAACTRLPLAGRRDEEYNVLLPDGRTGTIPEKDCVVENEEFGKNVTPEDIMSAAEFLGSDYRWGGLTASGIDCSGFVYIVFRMNGIYLKRDSYMQADEGSMIPENDLRPGDLVFFSPRGKKRISHVGIYIGDGNFIHASKSFNGVIVSSLSEDRFRRGFVAARRVLGSPGRGRTASLQMHLAGR